VTTAPTSDPDEPFEHSRSRWCANRFPATALAFVALSTLDVFYVCRSLGKELPHSDSHYLLGSFLFVFSLPPVYMSFECLRERLVLKVFIFTYGFGFLVRVWPALIGSAASLYRPACLAAYLVALLLSLSMLYSAWRFQKQPPQ